MDANIILVGPMASGKSAIGISLAHKLQKGFLDTDSLLTERFNSSISEFFDKFGEQKFRQEESAVLANLDANANLVIATGGGIVIAQKNRELLQKLGIVVYLKARLNNIYYRTKNTTSRPILNNSDDKKATIKKMLQERAGFYEDIAAITIGDNGNKEVKINRILKNL